MTSYSSVQTIYDLLLLLWRCPVLRRFLGRSAPDDSFEMNTFKPVSILQQINSRLTPCGEEKPLPTLRISTDKDTHNQKEFHLKVHQHGQSGRFDDGSSLPTSMFSKYKDGQLQREDHMNGQLTPFDNENPPSTSRTAITLDISAEHIQKELSAEPHQHDEETPMLPSTFFSQGKTFAETYQHGQSNPFEPPDSASADTDAQVCRELSTKDYQHGQSGPLLTKLEIASLLQNAAATLEDAKLIHDHIARHGPAMDRYLGNLFISLYGKHGAVIEARSVFDSMPERCVVSWNAMIATYSQQGFAVEALQLFQLMQQEDVKAAGATFVSSLNACAELVDLPQGKAIHKMITSSAILPNSFVQTALINMYGKCGALQEAKLVFDDIDPHDVVSWTSIISACSRHGHGEESLELFEQMQKEGIEPNTITFVSVLSSFESPVFLSYGKLIHLYIVKEGLESDVTVATALINMYSKCGDLQCACSLFEKLHLRNVVSWSAMVGAYVEHGCSNIALQLFQEMQLEGIQPNKVTLLHALDACGELAALDKGHTMYTNIINWGMETDVVLGTSIINMFHQSGAMEDAFAVFSRICDRNVFVWNSMIGAYAQRGDSEKVLEFFQSMQQEGGSPDEFTFLSVLSACTSLHALQEGEATHACIIDSGLELDTVVGTGLLNMYGKCKSLRKACILFDKIAVLDIICFNALIGAFVQQGKDKGALQLYHKMLKQGFTPDAVTYVNILSACANLVGQAEGEAIHASIIESGFCNHSSDQCAKTSDTAGRSWDKQSELWGTGTTSEHMANRKCREHDDSKWNNSEVPIANALISMYGSCGDMDSAFLVFNRMRCRDVVSWNALIAALTEQGHAQEALQIFQKMHLELVTPNYVTFGSILAACSRAGLVKEAQGYFSSMIEDYRISPTIEHCRCMIDLFARAGQLDDAEDFIANSQLRTNALAWMTLLSSCRLYGETDRGIRAAEIVIELDPRNSTPYVLLLNIYASAGRWDDVEKLKQRMREKGLKGPAGSSCVGIEKMH